MKIHESDSIYFSALIIIRIAECTALIDTGMGFCDIKAAISPLLETPLIVFNTHWHFDHIGGNALFQNIGIHPLEQQLLEKAISSGSLYNLYIKEHSMPISTIPM